MGVVASEMSAALGARAAIGLAERRRHAFATARRHSKRVRRLRVLLPALTAVLLLGPFVASWLASNVELPVEVDRVFIDNGMLTMENARMSGFNSDSQSYEVTAQTAAQELTNPKVVRLTGINGVLRGTAEEGSTLVAERGVYDSTTEMLNLQDNIVVRSNEGYEVFLDTAEVDLKSGRVVSRAPVEIRMISGTVNAQGLEIENKGEIIRFTGGVLMTIIPKDAVARDASPAPAGGQ